MAKRLEPISNAPSKWRKKDEPALADDLRGLECIETTLQAYLQSTPTDAFEAALVAAANKLSMELLAGRPNNTYLRNEGFPGASLRFVALVKSQSVKEAIAYRLCETNPSASNGSTDLAAVIAALVHVRTGLGPPKPQYAAFFRGTPGIKRFRAVVEAALPIPTDGYGYRPKSVATELERCVCSGHAQAKIKAALAELEAAVLALNENYERYASYIDSFTGTSSRPSGPILEAPAERSE